MRRSSSRAAEWYAARGEAEAAIVHALRAGDLGRAAALVSQHWYRVFQSGRNLLVAEWLEALPDERTAADPWLALADATARLNTGAAHADVEWWLDRAEALAPDLREPRRSAGAVVRGRRRVA